MINTKRLATIFVLTAILITGSLNAIQYAYSSGPDTLTVKYLGPIADDPAETIIQIYKKIDDFSNPPLDEISIDATGDEFMVISLNYGKDKLNSNTVFRVIERTSGSDDVEIDVAEIHTSCSKSLYKGQIVDGQVFVGILEVVDGTLLGDSILPDNVGEECTDNKKPKHTATITLKKAITNDNGGAIISADQIQENFLPKIDGVDVIFGEPVTISTKEPHTISEADVVGYSFVLIAGDTDCPSMLGEEFTVKKNKDITCTIYNDDNGDGSTGGGGPGVVFHFETIQLTLVDPAVGKDCANTSNVAPCVGIIDTKSFIVRPDTSLASQDLTPTTLILLSVLPSSDFSLATQCTVAGLNAVGTVIDGFTVECLDTNAGNTYNFNLALIETSMP